MDGKIRLEGGKVVLSLRGSSYEARVHVAPRQYIWRGLKTDQLEVAKRSALKLLYEVEFKQRNGLSIFNHGFSAVIDEYVALCQKQHDRATQKQKDQNYTSPAMLRQIKRVVKFWLSGRPAQC
ncbi:hypothetical protein GCM10010909_30460 [Acidocella aquatica]|uniref:Integrase n=1 Tax=Acidocella aquatica TaxID=1922313 RepID=A0ABQ6A7E5_9PROT|nr:hypothetical protein [Acidocella aquatica]GLR68365.1 hypothetical protein GCM10010909_30460 [Acidocella aquatica]